MNQWVTEAEFASTPVHLFRAPCGLRALRKMLVDGYHEVIMDADVTDRNSIPF
jgi:hypothetical protein